MILLCVWEASVPSWARVLTGKLPCCPSPCLCKFNTVPLYAVPKHDLVA